MIPLTPGTRVKGISSQLLGGALEAGIAYRAGQLALRETGPVDKADGEGPRLVVPVRVADGGYLPVGVVRAIARPFSDGGTAGSDPGTWDDDNAVDAAAMSGYRNGAEMVVSAPTGDAGEMLAILEDGARGDAFFVPAVVLGMARAAVYVNDASHRYAAPFVGDDPVRSLYLESVASGPIQLSLSSASDAVPGFFWRYVLLGGAGAGADADMLVRVAEAGTDGNVPVNEVLALPTMQDGTNYTWSRTVINGWYPVGNGKAPS